MRGNDFAKCREPRAKIAAKLPRRTENCDTHGRFWGQETGDGETGDSQKTETAGQGQCLWPAVFTDS